MSKLYQPDPFPNCTYTLHKNRSFTDSRESYQYGAGKETLILRWNGRIPTQEFVLHFKTVFTAQKINEYRKKIFRVLVDNGFEGVASIELTRGKNGKPNDTVHFTLLTDDQRSEPELRCLLEMACERRGLVKDKDFWISYQEIPDGYGRFNYFTKYGEKYFDEVILFEKGLLESGKTLQKFYTLGQWYKKGRGKGKIWEEIKAYCQEKYGTDIEETCSSDEIEFDGIADDELPSEPVQNVDVEVSVECTNENKSSDRFVWLKYRNSLVPIDKRLLADIPDDYPNFDYPLPAENIRDRRNDWQRFKYSVAFLQ